MIMPVKRKVLVYLCLIVFVVVLGLSSRYLALHLPWWVNLYVGDSLWALMMFLIFGILLRTSDTNFVAVVSLLFCYFIEISQLYHSPLIDSIRNTVIGGLILGRGFLWSDLISYSVGIGIGFVLDKLILSYHKNLI